MFFVGGGEKCEGLSLTSAVLRVRIHPYADVVELVDSLDLGSNARACRFESCHPHQIAKGRLMPAFFAK